jgi:serine/threonine protein kinase
LSCTKGFNWYYLHITALNTAWIIQAIHDKGYVLGDIKPQNILVNDRALVAVIDTDSFQVRDSQTRKIYRCTVGSEGFTPVELLGQDFAITEQTEVHDRFRLAVLIHYLLFGYHPFSGEWKGSGDSPEQTELIRKGFWYGGQNSLIGASQNTIPLDVVHPEVKRLFLKCFNEGHSAPHLRPTAEDWHNALQVAVNDLKICSNITNHHYSQTHGKCYWCERKVKLGIDIFPAVTSTSPTAANKTTTRSTVTQAVSHSTQPNQTFVPPISKPVSNSSSTIPSYQLSQPITNRSLQDWQKAVITGSVIGIFTFLGLVSLKSNTAPQQTVQTPIETLREIPIQSSSVETKQQTELPQSSDLSNQKEHNQEKLAFSSYNFPLNSCGDKDPGGINTWYPVNVDNTEENLISIRSNYCRDAFPKYRKQTGLYTIQVASFLDRTKAEAFAELIRQEIVSSEVGEPSVFGKNSANANSQKSLIKWRAKNYKF